MRNDLTARCHVARGSAAPRVATDPRSSKPDTDPRSRGLHILATHPDFQNPGMRKYECRTNVAFNASAKVQLEDPLVLLPELNLERAKLSEAHLESARLREAHLERAYLRQANLEGAYSSTRTSGCTLARTRFLILDSD